jgi:hypothetical protein
MNNINDDINRAWVDRIGAYVQKRLAQAGVDWDTIAELDLTVSPDGTATLALRDGARIAFGENDPDEYSETPYWMATLHDVDGSQAEIFDGSEDEQVLWTRLAERIRG